MTNPQTEPVSVRGQPPAQGARTMRSIFKPHIIAIVAGAVILTLTNAFNLVLPRLINEGIDTVEGRTPKESVLLWFGVEAVDITVIVIAIIGAALLGALFRVLSRVILFNVGRDVEREVRGEVFSHLSTLSPTYFAKNSTGDLMSRLTNDLNNVRLMSGFALLNIVNAVQVFFATVPLLFALDWRVALCALLPYPLVMGAAQALAKVMYRRTRKNQEALGALTTHVQENLAGQEVVRAFSQADGEIKRFGKTNARAYDAAMSLAMIRVIFFPLMGLMSALGIAISLYVGGRAVIDGRMSIGDVVEFNARLLQLTWPAIAMGFIISVYQRGKAGLDRINQIYAARPDIVDGDYSADVVGSVRADNLTVAYPEQDEPVLNALSFELKAGGVLGVVGTNASGKSTLVRALARMMPIEEGQLAVDGRDLNDWALRKLSSGMSVVTDDGFLFSATLKENLAFGRPNATDEEINDVVEIADLSRDVETFEKGLQTLVGERGVTLSGGQKQRVALARALLTRPRILILDDSLSAVDAETESRIVHALRSGRFAQGGIPPTLIVISHRLSAVKEADEIVVLDGGHVTERGQHDALLDNNALYAALWGKEQLMTKLTADVGEEVPS